MGNMGKKNSCKSLSREASKDEGFESSIYFKKFCDVGRFGKSIVDKKYIKVVKCERIFAFLEPL